MRWPWNRKTPVAPDVAALAPGDHMSWFDPFAAFSPEHGVHCNAVVMGYATNPTEVIVICLRRDDMPAATLALPFSQADELASRIIRHTSGVMQ